MASSGETGRAPTEEEFERLRLQERKAFLQARTVENYYGRRLRMLATHIGNVVRDFHINEHSSSGEIAELQQWLIRYADSLDPWARSVAERVIREIGQRDTNAWRRVTRRIRIGVMNEIQNADVGKLLADELANQVQLIKSIPLEAAMRVHELAVGNIYGNEPFTNMIEQIMNTGNISKNRATLIARTETARVASTFTSVRAQAAGITHFYWRTQRDNDVRRSHAQMANQLCTFEPPPEVEPGKRYLPGTIYNCRCYVDPLIKGFED